MMYDFKKRISKIAGIMRERGIDLFLVTPGSDMKYLIGYEHPLDDKVLLFVLLPDGSNFVIHNKLHDIDPEHTPADEMFSYAYELTPEEVLFSELKKRDMDAGLISVSSNMPAFFALKLKEHFPKAEFIATEDITAPLRSIKDEAEIAATREACLKASEALRLCMDRGSYWIGKTEQQLEAYLMYLMGDMGLRHNAVSVCFGENAVSTHHHPDETVIEWGKPLLIDFGADYHFYNTDMTRMFFFGEATDEYKKIYDIVLSAELLGIEMAKCGGTLQELDMAVRNYFGKLGYGEYYIHRTSHGVGLDCHDVPKIPVNGETPIENGMIFSVEPGLYLPGKFGVRIEDQIAMVDGRAEILHPFTKELIEIK